MSPTQRENTAKLLLDLVKIIVTVFVVGGLVPDSPIGRWQIAAGLGLSLIMYLAAMLLLKGDQNEQR